MFDWMQANDITLFQAVAGLIIAAVILMFFYPGIFRPDRWR